MAEKYRREAVKVLRRFVRGEIGADELEVAVSQLDLPGIVDICESLAFSPGDYRQIDLELGHLARQLRLHLDGSMTREKICAWVLKLHEIVTSRGYESSAVSSPKTAATLGLLSILLDPNHPAPPLRVKRALETVHCWLRANKPIPARKFLPRLFRDMGAVELRVLESPAAFSLERPGQPFEEWFDVGLRVFQPDRVLEPDRGEVRLIPFSVFTKTFFQIELPRLISRIEAPAPLERLRDDKFYYHCENDQAISLRERFPSLKGCGSFQYYVDGSGLGEIVLDAPRLGRSELSFAATLFCLQNGVRRATLDGKAVSRKLV